LWVLVVDSIGDFDLMVFFVDDDDDVFIVDDGFVLVFFILGEIVKSDNCL
jgi:hypothetical protein